MRDVTPSSQSRPNRNVYTAISNPMARKKPVTIHVIMSTKDTLNG
jgi:hypothetical protein